MSVTNIHSGAKQLNSQLGKRLTQWGVRLGAIGATLATPLSAGAMTREKLPELTRPINSAEVRQGTIQAEGSEFKPKIEGAKLAQFFSAELGFPIGDTYINLSFSNLQGRRYANFGRTIYHRGQGINQAQVFRRNFGRLNLPYIQIGGRDVIILEQSLTVSGRFTYQRGLYTYEYDYDNNNYYLAPFNAPPEALTLGAPPTVIPQTTYQRPQNNLNPFNQVIRENGNCAFDLFDGITKERQSVKWLNTNYDWCFNRAQQLDPNNPYITGTGSVQSALDRSPNEILRNGSLAIPIPGAIRNLRVQEYWDGTFKGF